MFEQGIISPTVVFFLKGSIPWVGYVKIYMIINKITEQNKKFPTELFFVFTNLATFSLLLWQNIQTKMQEQSLLTLTSKMDKIKERVGIIEQLPGAPEKHAVILLNNAGQSQQPNLLKWVLIVILLAVTVYGAYILYAKWFSFSLFAYLPTMELPYDLIPLLKKSKAFEVILGDYTLRLTTAGKNVQSIEAKHLEDTTYKPLEQVLQQNNSAVKDITTNATQTLLESTESSEIASRLYLDPDVADAVTTVADSVQTVLNVI